MGTRTEWNHREGRASIPCHVFWSARKTGGGGGGALLSTAEMSKSQFIKTHSSTEQGFQSMPLLCHTHWLYSRKLRNPCYTGRYPNTQPISFSNVCGGGAGGEWMAQGSRNQPQSFLWRICHLGHLPGLSRSWNTAAGQSAHPARLRAPLWDQHTPDGADAPSGPTQQLTALRGVCLNTVPCHFSAGGKMTFLQ